MAPAAGRFITFEGGEGGGKTTQLARLAEDLRAAGHAVLTTREPGGSPGAEEIRRLLVTGEAGRWDARTEALLHMAARRDHLVRVVWPALAEGKVVLCDRFLDSTRAYQGYGHGLGRDWVDRLASVVIGDFAPDLTLILDLDPAQGLARAAGRGDAETRYETLADAFHQRVREGFHAIAKAEPGRCRLIDSSQPKERVAALIAGQVRALLAASPQAVRTP
ncbi:dTMP kinase [Roseospirillum parvum]|uniref:Thymidylate kinase n=1 Tax=Roseospirillum parvum TaxID=83401 RepID=A0A1G7Y819_9PROT|nr:dTMP kinase [Roseospirillum parvum]SDG92507.1 dTMP kinase [Roseospirillum parvum]